MIELIKSIPLGKLRVLSGIAMAAVVSFIVLVVAVATEEPELLVATMPLIALWLTNAFGKRRKRRLQLSKEEG